MREELLSAPESQEGQVRVQRSDERAGQPVTCRYKYPPKMQITAPLFQVKSRGREGPPSPVHTVTLSLVTHWAPTLFTQGAPTVLPHEARALVPQLSSRSEPEACSHAEPQPPSHTGIPHPPHTRGTNPGHTPSFDPPLTLSPDIPQMEKLDAGHKWSPDSGHTLNLDRSWSHRDPPLSSHKEATPGHTPSTDPHYKLIPEPPHSWSPNLLTHGALTLITN